MILTYLLILLLGLSAIRNGNRIIREKYQDAGYVTRGWNQAATSYARYGTDAVRVGQIFRAWGIILIIVTFTEIVGLHSSAWEITLCLIIIQGIGIQLLYPPVVEIKKRKNEEDQLSKIE